MGTAPVVYIEGSNTYSIQSDHLGTPHRVVDQDQYTVWEANYAPYGEATVTVEQISFNHRFSGQYFDAETETHYNYLRDYDPATGRYLTNDPIGVMGGPNRYAYVNANPSNATDIYGLAPTWPTPPAPTFETPEISLAESIRIGGHLGQWVSRLLQSAGDLGRVAGAGPGGPVVSVYALASYFNQHHENQEQAFRDQFGYAPTLDMYNTVMAQIERFDPALRIDVPHYTGFQSLFAAVAVLERAQRNYIDNYRLAESVAPGSCELLGLDADLYQEALDAVALADAARNLDRTPNFDDGRLIFPVHDSEAQIYVTPGEPHAQVVLEGSSTVINVAAIPTSEDGQYIFVPIDDDTEALGTLLGFPIAPNEVIVLMNQSNSNLEFDDSKFDYLFGRVDSNQHNYDRSQQMQSVFSQIGIYDTPESRELLIEHFDETIREPDNVVGEPEVNEYGTFETRESIFWGPGGSVHLTTTFEIMPDGSRRFVTTIPRT